MGSLLSKFLRLVGRRAPLPQPVERKAVSLLERFKRAIREPIRPPIVRPPIVRERPVPAPPEPAIWRVDLEYAARIRGSRTAVDRAGVVYVEAASKREALLDAKTYVESSYDRGGDYSYNVRAVHAVGTSRIRDDAEYDIAGTERDADEES